MMKDFNFYAPTRVVFGRESEAKLPELIRQYGGTKVRRCGGTRILLPQTFLAPSRHRTPAPPE